MPFMVTVAKAQAARPRPKTPPQRSRLELAVETALRNAPYTGLRAVQCRVREGMAILRGEVTSFFLKQVAQ